MPAQVYENRCLMERCRRDATQLRHAKRVRAGRARLQIKRTGRPRIGFLRFYEPNLQRWINRDPIEELGGINLYGFILNNPNYYVEYLGLQVAPVPVIYPILTGGTSSAGGGGVTIFVTGTGASTVGAGTILIGAVGGAPAPLTLWFLLQSQQAPTLYPDPLYTGVYNPIPSKAVCESTDKENCPLEDQHDMGPLVGYRCEYWCRKSGARPVIYVPHAEGGCPRYIEQ